MPENEIHEMHEQAEHARSNPSLKPVSLTMAVLAVLVAVVTLLGHRSHTEAILMQSRATDQWAYYQAKGIRRHTYEIFSDLVPSITRDPAQAENSKEKYAKQAERYRGEQDEIGTEARKLEHEVAIAEHKGDRFNMGEVFLEIALVVTSITLLTSNRAYWGMGLLFAALGLVVAATGFLVH